MPADNLEQTLIGNAGQINSEWTQLQSGDHIVRVNPRQVAYIAEDAAYDSTFASAVVPGNR